MLLTLGRLLVLLAAWLTAGLWLCWLVGLSP